MFKIKEMLERVLLRNKVPFAVDEKGIYTICEGGKVYEIKRYDDCIVVMDNELKNEFEYRNWLMLEENIRRVSKGGGFRVDIERMMDEYLENVWGDPSVKEFLENKFNKEEVLKMIDEEVAKSKEDIEVCGVSIAPYHQGEMHRVVQEMLSGATSYKELEEIKEIIVSEIESW